MARCYFCQLASHSMLYIVYKCFLLVKINELVGDTLGAARREAFGVKLGGGVWVACVQACIPIVYCVEIGTPFCEKNIVRYLDVFEV